MNTFKKAVPVWAKDQNAKLEITNKSGNYSIIKPDGYSIIYT